MKKVFALVPIAVLVFLAVSNYPSSSEGHWLCAGDEYSRVYSCDKNIYKATTGTDTYDIIEYPNGDRSIAVITNCEKNSPENQEVCSAGCGFVNLCR